MATTLAVVVCSRDRPEQLRACLPALLAQPATEVLVVDSASATEATAQVAAEFGVRCVRVEQPGLARARNAALRATTADLVAFTDDDCVPATGWATAILTRATEATTKGERTGFVTGRVLASGDGQPVSVLLTEVPRTYRRDDDPSHVGHGANLTVTRECWAAIGGFDELLGVGGELRSAEDTDFLWRALRQDFVGHYEPAAVVTHEQWRNRAAALRTSYGYGIGAGAVRTKIRRLAGRKAARKFTAGSLKATLRHAATDARAGYEYGTATNLVRIAGLLVGRTRAGRMSLDHGHLVPR
jgi:glycosyltransferase involved in cell wall biosynthesis